MSNTCLQETTGLSLGRRIGKRDISMGGRCPFQLIYVEKTIIMKCFFIKASFIHERAKSFAGSLCSKNMLEC